MKNKAILFKELHIKGNPLILFNIWDSGSAKALDEIGVAAIATSSWSVASAHGYHDGENLPFELVLANLERIIANVSVPVTIDLEGGYGQSATQIYDTTLKIITAGAVGINLEDQIIGEDNLYSCDDQCSRISGARDAALFKSIPIFINARTDIFLKSNSENHDDYLEEAISRASAYAEAGADGFFVPGLQDENLIKKLCEAVHIPINIMISPTGPSSTKLAELGVARISYGPMPYCETMGNFKERAYKAFM